MPKFEDLGGVMQPIATAPWSRGATGVAGQAPYPPFGRGAGIGLAVLRILLGSVFLWAFLDKTFGLGLGTDPKNSWVSGGRPTSGYLGSLDGSLAGLFQPLAGQVWVDWTFMVGMLLIGTALVLGVALWAAALGGSLMMGALWLSSWPLQQHPFVDEHVIYAVTLWVLALTGAGQIWGLGRLWNNRPIRSS